MGTDTHCMAGGSRHRDIAPPRVLLPCAFAITVSTALVTAVALFNVDEVSSSALALDAFRLGASALFLAAGLLRLTRWRVTTDPNSALLAAAMLVLGILCLPLGNLVTQVVHDGLEPTVALAGRAIGTVACLALALRAMTVSDEDTATDWARALLTAGAVASAGLAGLVVLFSVAPTTLTHRALLAVVIDLALAGAWVALGLAASRRDVKQPWAGRVAPLYASLGVVELLYALDQVQPGSWSMPAVALLSSVAMITAHASYVDLTEAVRTADRVGRRAAGLGEGVTAILTSTGDATEPRTDVDVTALVNDVVRHRTLRRAGGPRARPGRLRPRPRRRRRRRAGAAAGQRAHLRPAEPGHGARGRDRARASRSPWPTAGPACRPPPRAPSAPPRSDGPAVSGCTWPGP